MERDCESELSKLNIEQNACIYHFGASVIHGQRSNILRLPNKDGQKVYTTDVVVEEQEFAESNNAGGGDGFTSASRVPDDGFMMIPDGIDDELPFV